MSAIIVNGLPTPPDTPAPAQPHTQTQIRIRTQTQTQPRPRPLLPTRRSRTREAGTNFHGTGLGLSFGLNVFGDDPVLTPRASFSREEDVRRTPGAPTRGGSEGAGYLPDVTPTLRLPTRAALPEVESDEENVFRAF